jgi:ribosomal protein S18 acetylase RimI-like enzyme
MEAAASESWLTHLVDQFEDRLPTDTLGAFSAGGSLAAMALVVLPDEGGEHVARFDGSVHVDHRGRGLGSFIMEWVENRARREFEGFGDGEPQWIQAGCPDRLADRIALFGQRGFEAVRYSYRMRRDLRAPVPEIPLGSGLRYVPWSAELDLPMMDAFNQAFRGSWGVPEMNEALWGQFFTGVPQFRGDLTTLAMSGDAIAGFCLNWVDAARDAQTGVKEGWVEAIGVVPGWRGRGVASALLSKALRDFVALGFERAALDVDTQNPTGALRLYERLGFEAYKRTILFQKQLNRT